MENKSQTCTTLSTCGLCISSTIIYFVKEIIWAFKYCTDNKGIMILYCDSLTSISYTKDLIYHNKTNHIDIKCNFLREPWQVEK